MSRTCLFCGRPLGRHQKKYCSRECHLAARGLALRKEGAAQKYPQLHDPDWLAAKIAAGGTATTIAAEIGCARATVRAAMQQAGLNQDIDPRRGRAPPKQVRISADLAARLGLLEAA
ncbi:hypothetical protein J2129_002738 [Methanofollis sp. W23]|uniref:hypothetical protein n=1 Tax=Methanofollis sp. W23 TaxID=2817849 RepID=UPI001AE56CA0|nr:hypothetical protein [Methanofollis sp. W23]MBP2147225.1 hypothetical protein [Methanofollis sp. W23]